MADTDPIEATMNQLTENQSLVKIYLNDSVLFIPSYVLISAFRSQEAFNEEFEFDSPQASTIRQYKLHDGCVDAWKIFFHWVVHRDSLPTADVETLVDCCQIGYQFEIPRFQDEAMIQLLQHFEQPSAQISYDLLCAPFERSSDEWSELKELLVEEFVKCIYHHGVEFSHGELEQLAQCPGLFTAFIRLHKRFIKDRETFFERFTKRDGKITARCEYFLAHDGIRKTWDRDEDGQPNCRKKRKWNQVN